MLTASWNAAVVLRRLPQLSDHHNVSVVQASSRDIVLTFVREFVCIQRPPQCSHQGNAALENKTGGVAVRGDSVTCIKVNHLRDL